MKNLKLLSILLLVVFASCKKDNKGPEDDNKAFDIKDYYLAGKMQSGNGLSMPYMITFDVNAKALAYTVSINSQSNYTYENGVLTIDFGNNFKDVFTIKDGKITGFQGVDDLDSYSLQKIPATNQLNGNTYSGGWKNPNNNLLTLATLKFNATQYGETSIGDPVINKDYTLIKNAAATSNTGANGTLSFFVLIDGKLEGSRYTASPFSLSVGTFTKK